VATMVTKHTYWYVRRDATKFSKQARWFWETCCLPSSSGYSTHLLP